MNIVLTGSLGNIGKPLTHSLVQQGHAVTVISRNKERRTDIEALGAQAAIGTIQETDFLATTFAGADIVYLMEAWEGIGSMFDKELNFIDAFAQIGHNYQQAVEQSGVKRIVHLSSIGAHTDKANGSLRVHYTVENILRALPEEVAIKFMRPAAFYTNMYRYVPTIKTKGAIVQSYGGDQKEPWVSPLDIAATIAEAMEKPFDGRTVHYIASEELSPHEIAKTIGEAIGQPALRWLVIPEEQMRHEMVAAGMNEWIAQGFVEMQAAQGSGTLYEDYYRHPPRLGSVKFKDFAKEFAAAYNH